MQNSPHKVFISVLSSMVLNVTTDGVVPFPWDIITKPNSLYFQEVLFSVQLNFPLLSTIQAVKPNKQKYPSTSL